MTKVPITVQEITELLITAVSDLKDRVTALETEEHVDMYEIKARVEALESSRHVQLQYLDDRITEIDGRIKGLKFSDRNGAALRQRWETAERERDAVREAHRIASEVDPS